MRAFQPAKIGISGHFPSLGRPAMGSYEWRLDLQANDVFSHFTGCIYACLFISLYFSQATVPSGDCIHKQTLLPGTPTQSGFDAQSARCRSRLSGRTRKTQRHAIVHAASCVSFHKPQTGPRAV